MYEFKLRKWYRFNNNRYDYIAPFFKRHVCWDKNDDEFWFKNILVDQKIFVQNFYQINFFHYFDKNRAIVFILFWEKHRTTSIFISCMFCNFQFSNHDERNHDAYERIFEILFKIFRVRQSDVDIFFIFETCVLNFLLSLISFPRFLSLFLYFDLSYFFHSLSNLLLRLSLSSLRSLNSNFFTLIIISTCDDYSKWFCDLT